MARHTFDKLVEKFAFAVEMLREGRKMKSETKSKQKRCVDRNLKNNKRKQEGIRKVNR